MRVALTDFRWPLDPALAQGRDETTLARALYATPLRTDPVTGAVVPGLCTAWHASAGFARWTFTCRGAPAIAATLKRVVRLRASPARLLFAGARIVAPSASSLVVELDRPWRRFPYALTAVAAAPQLVPGPFRVVSGSARRVVVRRPGLTIVFRRLGPRAAVREFSHGRLDEAPVPLGDIVATSKDSALRGALRTRTLLGLDLVLFRGAGPVRDVRSVYWETANRNDYEELVPELKGSAAYDLLGRTQQQQQPARFRDALKRIPSLPRVQVRIGVLRDPVLRYGAGILYAQWRDVGLGPVLVDASVKGVTTDFRRLLALYPQAEALPASIVLNGIGSKALLAAALAATEQRRPLERLEEELRSSERVVPIAWVRDARLISPRLDGWRENVLGNVDYGSVSVRASGKSG